MRWPSGRSARLVGRGAGSDWPRALRIHRLWANSVPLVLGGLAGRAVYLRPLEAERLPGFGQAGGEDVKVTDASWTCTVGAGHRRGMTLAAAAVARVVRWRWRDGKPPPGSQTHTDWAPWSAANPWEFAARP